MPLISPRRLLHAFPLAALATTLAAQTSAAPPAKPVPMKAYTDRGNGVSFQYPAAWTFSTKGTFYDSPAAIVPADSDPQAVVTFNSAGNVYAKTNLAGLDFTYVALPKPSREACLQQAAAATQDDGTTPKPISLNGIVFVHAVRGDAGMCHQVSGDVYATYRAGRCFLFEADTHTICPGVVDGTHALTPAESKALARHLDAIIRTVTINPPN